MLGFNRFPLKKQDRLAHRCDGLMADHSPHAAVPYHELQRGEGAEKKKNAH